MQFKSFIALSLLLFTAFFYCSAEDMPLQENEPEQYWVLNIGVGFQDGLKLLEEVITVLNGHIYCYRINGRHNYIRAISFILFGLEEELLQLVQDKPWFKRSKLIKNNRPLPRKITQQ